MSRLDYNEEDADLAIRLRCGPDRGPLRWKMPNPGSAFIHFEAVSYAAAHLSRTAEVKVIHSPPPQHHGRAGLTG